MPESVQAVKEVISFLRDVASSAKGDYPKILSGHADNLEDVKDELVRLMDLTSALPSELTGIHDLPEDILSELSAYKTDELEDQLVTVINAYGGRASLDQILVGLYRKFKVHQKRKFLQNKLYRMEVVWGVEGKKGVYTTAEPVEELQGYDDPPESAYSPPPTASRDLDDEVPF